MGRPLAFTRCTRPAFRHEANADAILVFSVKSTKVLAFAKGTFGQTRHRFSQE